MSAKFLHHAPWVVPVSAPIISDGAVITDNAHIIEIGPFNELKQKYPETSVYSHTNCALIPALVNAHIHLELSHIPIPQFREHVSGFTDWINTLLNLREEKGDLGKDVEAAAREVLQQQHQQGVVALGDIGNTDFGSTLRTEFSGDILHFNERLGRSSKTRRSILKEVDASSPDKMYTAHAPYSTHPELIQKLKNRAIANNHPFPIHVAEPSSENDMLCCGTGELADFFKDRGFINDSYTPPAAIDNQGSVQYLHDLGGLDKNTICVHCIHVTQEEIQMIADTGAKICLCPGSNRYLHVGSAPVKQFLDAGILPALGTDSLASNPELSLWREMKILHRDILEIDPANILEMATLGGAKALGLDHSYGSLASDKSTRFLAIPLTKTIKDESMLYTYLVQHQEHQPLWVNEL